MTVELGFGLITCQRYPGDPRTDRDIYAEALALAEHAERLGFDSVWTSEHHFIDDSYLPSVLTLSAAIAARTRTIRIGTGLMLAPLHEPLRIAEDAAVVDLISDGRLVLGIGLGWRVEEFEALGVRLADRVRRLEDSIAVYRQAWSGELVTGGDHLSYPDVPVRPLPARRGGPPIWIGGMSEPAIRRAGRLADGFMATEVTAASLAEQVEAARDAHARAGREGELAISVHLPTFAWPDDDAWELVRPYHWYVSWKYDDMDAARHRAGAPPPAPEIDDGLDRSLREQIVMGSAAEVAERIRELADAAGGNLHYIARLYFPGMAPDVQREAMRIFAEEVAPALR
ncbi:MAG TPA: LLM class flavin-dependent oxidoreductase [Actinomycetota bacterium]|nr:LLM class flavin-dependent oxidoreductase [Actinomycetota bacterium]